MLPAPEIKDYGKMGILSGNTAVSGILPGGGNEGGHVGGWGSAIVFGIQVNGLFTSGTVSGKRLLHG
ncbi:hypothetical protein L21SP2_1550 [Salinispira pacifica]|uniref:Uncharacterized protein n=1 Tax=Salinispira pacifica TaxID=1307761 RepID=V5WGN0_9SPIO|nr:hypothetical protein L21SP2_1550 [Salinispira pacifica]